MSVLQRLTHWQAVRAGLLETIDKFHDVIRARKRTE
jgi:hypothetical protein